MNEDDPYERALMNRPIVLKAQHNVAYISSPSDDEPEEGFCGRIMPG